MTEVKTPCIAQDMAYWPPLKSDTRTATCWLALDDATVENGCMRWVPGTHKEKHLRPHAPGARGMPKSKGMHAFHRQVHLLCAAILHACMHAEK